MSSAVLFRNSEPGVDVQHAVDDALMASRSKMTEPTGVQQLLFRFGGGFSVRWEVTDGKDSSSRQNLYSMLNESRYVTTHYLMRSQPGRITGLVGTLQFGRPCFSDDANSNPCVPVLQYTTSTPCREREPQGPAFRSGLRTLFASFVQYPVAGNTLRYGVALGRNGIRRMAGHRRTTGIAYS